MELHDQAEKLRRQVAEESDPEDPQTYEGLKASVAVLYHMAEDVAALAARSACRSRLKEWSGNVAGYLKDVCFHHDIDIPEEDNE